MKKLSIYLIENDYQNIQRFTNKLKQQLDCVVKSFTNGDACLATLKQEKNNPDLILADHYLGTGRQKEISSELLLQSLKINYSSIPVMEFSTENGIDMLIQMVKQGALDLIENSSNFLDKIKSKYFNVIENLLSTYTLMKEQITISKIMAFLVFFNASLFVLFYATEKHLSYLSIFATIILISSVYQLRTALRKHKTAKTATSLIQQ